MLKPTDLFASRAGQAAAEVIERIQNHGYQAYAVGGCVRNHLLGLPIVDFDITTSARPEQVKQMFEKTIDTGIRFGTVTVIYSGIHIEVTTFRSESMYIDTRHPESVQYEESIEIDLSRRDFTMNAIACSIDGRLIDPFAGQADIKQQTIRSVGQPIIRMREDLLRCVRAFRFSAQLGFTIESETMGAIQTCASDLKSIARERVGVEWRKMLQGNHRMPLEQMIASGWMPVWDPSFSAIHDSDGWAAFQELFRQLEDEESRLVCLTILLDKEESALRDWMQSLRYSKKMIQTCVALKQLVNRYKQLDLHSNRSGDQTYFYKLRHLLFEYGLNTMIRAQAILTCIGEKSNLISQDKLSDLYNCMPIHSTADLAVDGNDVIKAFGRIGGPWVKETLDKLTEKVLCEEIPNERQALLKVAKNELEIQNL